MEEQTGTNRDEQGKFIPGISGNPNGRKAETAEQKLMKRAVKELVEEYKQSLAQHLNEIEPVLLAKALSGDVAAIREVHDRVMGKPPQDMNMGTNPEMPFVINIIKADGNQDSGDVPQTV